MNAPDSVNGLLTLIRCTHRTRQTLGSTPKASSRRGNYSIDRFPSAGWTRGLRFKSYGVMAKEARLFRTAMKCDCTHRGWLFYVWVLIELVVLLAAAVCVVVRIVLGAKWLISYNFWSIFQYKVASVREARSGIESHGVYYVLIAIMSCKHSCFSWFVAHIYECLLLISTVIIQISSCTYWWVSVSLYFELTHTWH